jgi:EAL domain-containing protein (putative c-di-GMP-specific phosphodiesterase class I)
LGGSRIEVDGGAPVAGIGDDAVADALVTDQLALHYLPIVSGATGRVAGFEALLRWRHPERGLLGPQELLAQAEQTGLVHAVGSWTLEEACRQMAAWHEGTGATLKLNVNLSAAQFVESTLPSEVLRILTVSGIAPGSVWLEVTEETLTRDRDVTTRALHALRDVGVRLVVDDFGSGVSALASLRELPLDAVKIAPAFVADLGRGVDGTTVCRAIVDYAHSVGLCAIAEGVETLEQFAALRTLGCELVQGHLFGPARPAVDFGSEPASVLGLVRTPESS